MTRYYDGEPPRLQYTVITDVEKGTAYVYDLNNKVICQIPFYNSRLSALNRDITHAPNDESIKHEVLKLWIKKEFCPQNGEPCACVSGEICAIKINDYIIGEDNICPQTGFHCDDECCMPGGTCNLASDKIVNCNESNIIPTAEDFACETMQGTDMQEISYALIEFAKLHVKAALRAAARNADIKSIQEQSISSEQVRDLIIVDTKTILNAYPESNIK